MTSGAEGPSGESASREAAVAEESVIVISDDEGEASLLGNSVLLIEDVDDNSISQEKKTLEVLDEELAITFSRKAHVMPHARYDCSTHPFVREEQENQDPMEKNASCCAECYCYLCDKPASECAKWEAPGFCHCNAHNKSKYWKEQRDSALAGVLYMFNLDLTEIDAELKEGGNKLERFLVDLATAYYKYLEGTLMTHDSMERCVCTCHRQKVVNNKCNLCPVYHIPFRFHNYSVVHKTVTDYLDQLDEESPKAAAVILLGIAKELALHKALPNPFSLKDKATNVKEATVLLMARIVTTLQRLLVLKDYPATLYDKFVNFFRSCPCPPHFYTFISSLNVIRWDNSLLTSVLAGQNLTGTRTNKGKKECLWEALTVVESRVKKLEEQMSYRQLVRYLNTVRCPDYESLNSLKQKLCLYMCKYGDFSSAANCLLKTRGMAGSICKFFTPEHFKLHMIMLRTRSCPPENKLEWFDVLIPHSGVPLKSGVLIRTALKILLYNDHLYRDSKCWSALVRVWCTSETLSIEGRLVPLELYEPDKFLQQTVMGMSCTILDDLQSRSTIHLPEPFHKSHSSNAELILIVQAVIRYMLATIPPLRGMLELVVAFGFNHWALLLLIEGISPMPELLFNFTSCVNKELYESEPRILELLKRRGFSYMLKLVPLFLLYPSEGVRSIGFHFIDLVIRNLAHIPWCGNLGNCLNITVLPHVYMTSIERQRLVTDIGRLTARS